MTGAWSSNRKRMSEAMYAMLVRANGCSLPGDGLRIVGSQNNTASALERLGFVRVSRPSASKARVHITHEGRAERERYAQHFIEEESRD